MALINCRVCGKTVSDKAESCPHCGTPVANANLIRCPECGAMVAAGLSECSECGLPFVVSAPSQYPSTPDVDAGVNLLHGPGVLKLVYKGGSIRDKFYVEIDVNGRNFGKYYAYDGFEVCVPIESSKMDIVVRPQKSFSIPALCKISLELDPAREYVCNLNQEFDLWGYELYSNGILFKSDKVISQSLGIVVAILFWIAWVVYFFIQFKTSPIRAKSALVYALFGIIMNIALYIISYHI